MPSLIHLTYASAASRGYSETELATLLDGARRKNERLCVTGMLLYVDGSFFQVLEGSADAVDALFARIALDPRHRSVVTIIREPISQRAFGEWTMGFANMTREEVITAVGMNDFFGSKTCFDELDGGRAKKLLAAFAEGRWRVRHDSTRAHEAPRAHADH